MRSIRDPVPFSAVNHPDRPGYEPDMQRHHILPTQLRRAVWARRMFEQLAENIKMKLISAQVRKVAQGRKQDAE